MLTTLTDRKLHRDFNLNDTADFYCSDTTSFHDYYPFGAIMPGRNFNSNSYRYSVQGHEKDDEIKGTGNSIDFGARMYDPRLGRFLTPDPHLHFEYRSEPSPGLGLGGRLDPNEVLDTKFYSQDPSADQKKTGVTKVEKDGTTTKQDIGGKESIIKYGNKKDE